MLFKKRNYNEPVPVPVGTPQYYDAFVGNEEYHNIISCKCCIRTEGMTKTNDICKYCINNIKGGK